MIHITNENIEDVQHQLTEVRKQKSIQVQEIAAALNVKSPWVSEMFGKISTLQTSKFIELLNTMDIDVYLDLNDNNSRSVNEMDVDDAVFLEMVHHQWREQKIDGNQAMRKIESIIKTR